MDILYKTYVFSVQWCIDGLSIYPSVKGDRMTSRPFTVPGLGNTKWRLELGLEDKSSQVLIALSIFIRRLPNDEVDFACLSTDEIIVDLKLTIESHPEIKMAGKSFKLFDAHGSVFVWRNFSLFGREKPERFTIYCSISPSNGNIPGKHNDLMALSTDLGRLPITQKNYDILLLCDGKEFIAHRNILACRSKHFLKDLDIEPAPPGTVTKVNVQNISSTVLQTILTFIYTGTLDVPLSKVSRELFNAADRHGLRDLKRKLATHPKTKSLFTEISYERKSLRWVLDAEHRVLGKAFVSKMDVNTLYCDQIVMTCQIAKDDEFPDKHIVEFSFGIVGFNADIPICFEVTCNVSETCKAGEKTQDTFYHTFMKTSGETSTEVKIPVASDSPLADIECNILICDGGGILCLPSVGVDTEDDLIYDFEKLSLDMLDMLEYEMYADFRIICNGTEFIVHRNILQARSENFANYVLNDLPKIQNGTVEINDISPCTMQSLLTYFYLGTLPNLQYEDVKQLYPIAERFVILGLKSKCREYLLMLLSESNFLDIYGLATLHCDDFLKVACVNWKVTEDPVMMKSPKFED